MSLIKNYKKTFTIFILLATAVLFTVCNEQPSVSPKQPDPDIFISVTGITQVPTWAAVRTSLTLTGKTVPENATYSVISWEILNAGSTGAVINDGVLDTTMTGTVTLRAVIENGIELEVPYTEDFLITVMRPVTGITGVWERAYTGTPLPLSGNIIPVNATNRTIEWSVTEAGTTGAIISGNILETVTDGTAVLTATVKDGTGKGIDYTETFLITVNTVFDQHVTQVVFSGTEQTVKLHNLQNNDIFLVKVNTSNTEVNAISTGRVLNEIPLLGEITSPPEAIAIPGKVNPRMGRPPDEQIIYPQAFSVKVPLEKRFSFIQPEVGATRNFWIENSYGFTSFVQREATLLATGNYSNIWVISNCISASQAQTLADKFDITYPIETNILGYEYGGRPGHPNPGGMDQDLKVQILVYEIGGGTAGYFWGKDFYPDSETASWRPSLRSNEAEIFYIDATLARTRPVYANSTLIHEFQHMINFNEKTVEKDLNSPAWYNEMLSMMAQDVISELAGISTEEEDHVTTYSLPDFLLNYYKEGFSEWGLQNANWTSYTTKYAFGAYLLRNYTGADLLKNILANDSVGIESITQALREISSELDYTQALIRFSEAMIFNSQNLQNVNTFNRTVVNTINGTTYNIHGFDIWNTERTTSTQKGPVFFDLNQRTIRPHGICIHSADSWKDKTGNYSITFQRPSNPDIVFVLLVK